MGERGEAHDITPPSGGPVDGFAYFEHTADVGIEARGASLPQAFAKAAEALVNLLVDPATIRPDASWEIAVEAESVEDLLVAWLNEIIFRFDAEGSVPVAFSFSRFAANGLRARARGERFDARRHVARGGVKAATYHQVQVLANGGFTLRVIVDV